MKINGVSIQGIFKYNDTLEFEEGDFVIYDNSLYICNQGGEIGEGRTPEDSEQAKFSVYLGDKISGVDEYFDYLDRNGDGKDKYVSSHTLSGILNNYLFGVNERGIISEWIDYNKDGTGLTYSEGLSRKLSGLSINSRTIGNILTYFITPYSSINNALIAINPNLAIEGMLEFNRNDTTLENIMRNIEEEIVIFRQYTYTKDEGLYRCQELIFPSQGMVFWRASYPGINSTKWKSSFYYGATDRGNPKFLLDCLHNYYRRVSEELKNTKNSLENSYRYTSIPLILSKDPSGVYIKPSKITIQCLDPKEEYYMEVPEGSFYSRGSISELYKGGNNLVIDIVVRKLYNSANKIYKTQSITIDLLDSLLGGELSMTMGITKYSLDSLGATLTVIPDENPDKISLEVTSEDGSLVELSSIYYRKYYTNERDSLSSLTEE